MRRLLRFLTGLAASLISVAASAEPVRSVPDPYARSVALIEAVAGNCGAVYALDPDALRRYGAMFREAGRQALGGAAFATALEAATASQAEDMARSGAEGWCLARRSELLAIGLHAPFVRKSAVG